MTGGDLSVAGMPLKPTPHDGEFEHFTPELPVKSQEVLKKKGYMNLFPI